MPSPYPSAFNQKRKERVLERDGHRCVICHRSDADLPRSKRYSTNLVVHHVDGDKQNCEDWNLMTLCRSCQAKLHVGRLTTAEVFRRGLLRDKVAPLIPEVLKVLSFGAMFSDLASEVKSIRDAYEELFESCKT